MNKGKNNTVGAVACFVLVAVVVFFVLYNWFSSRAYGETPSLKQTLATGVLPYCSGRGAYDFRDGYRAVELEPYFKRDVVYFLERLGDAEGAKTFRNAAAVIGLIWQKREYINIDIVYFPANKNTNGRWCGESLAISNSFAPHLPDEALRDYIEKEVTLHLPK